MPVSERETRKDNKGQVDTRLKAMPPTVPQSGAKVWNTEGLSGPMTRTQALG